MSGNSGDSKNPGESDDSSDPGGSGDSPATGPPTIAGRTPTPPTTNRRRNAILWGVAGVLSFGVVHQAYLLLGGEFPGSGPVVAVAVLVGVVVGASAYWLSGELAGRNEQR